MPSIEHGRHECSSVISMELAIALAAQDKKVEDTQTSISRLTLAESLFQELIRSNIVGPLSHLESLPGQRQP